MCTSFKEASAGLCKVLVSVACRLCTSLIKEPAVLMPFVACRLIPLDKCPDVCPIGIGDVSRRMVAKAILFVIGTILFLLLDHFRIVQAMLLDQKLQFMP